MASIYLQSLLAEFSPSSSTSPPALGFSFSFHGVGQIVGQMKMVGQMGIFPGSLTGRACCVAVPGLAGQIGDGRAL